MTAALRVRTPVQGHLPLRRPAGIITEVPAANGLSVRIDGKLVARVINDPPAWFCLHVGAGCRRPYDSETTAVATARRIARMLVA